MFRYYGDLEQCTQPHEYIIGTDAEAYVRGEILTLASGVLTKAGVDSTGTQKFVCMNDQAAEATAVTPIGVMRLRGTMLFKTKSSGQIAATAIGAVYTLAADALGITTTITNGVFEIKETDGATVSEVVGFFPLSL